MRLNSRFSFGAMALSIGLTAPLLVAAQTTSDAALGVAFSEVVGMSTAIKEIAAKCGAIAPAQKSEFTDAQVFWSKQNSNELKFIDESLQSWVGTSAPLRTKVETDAASYATKELGAVSFTSENCNRWMSNVMTTDAWNYQKKMPQQMKLIGARFVKPS
jgi:hypothetical protein